MASTKGSYNTLKIITLTKRGYNLITTYLTQSTNQSSPQHSSHWHISSTPLLNDLCFLKLVAFIILHHTCNCTYIFTHSHTLIHFAKKLTFHLYPSQASKSLSSLAKMKCVNMKHATTMIDNPQYICEER